MSGHQHIPDPCEKETPLDYAWRLAVWVSETRTVEEKRKLGQIATPIPVAKFMSSLLDAEGESVRLLDMGAGTGVLLAGAVDSLVSRGCCVLEVLALEVDSLAIKCLQKLRSHLVEFYAGVADVSLVVQDQALEDLVPAGIEDKFDYVILNPPYYKINPGQLPPAWLDIVPKTPNAYAFFISAAFHALKHQGQVVWISPRSFTSGKYFESFRNFLLNNFALKQLHIITSRQEAFKHESVLQETVIVSMIKDDPAYNLKRPVCISYSVGIDDLPEGAVANLVHLNMIRRRNGSGSALLAPESKAQLDALKLLHGFRDNLASLGLKAMTGPVVAFRCRNHFIAQADKTAVPLLWLQNVKQMKTEWPVSFNKPQWFAADAGKPLVTSIRNIVLVRRFSSKDDNKRLIAAPLSGKELGFDQVAIENHLNYIQSVADELSSELALGLAAVLNSRLYDNYVRALSGNTQVGVNELNALPLPDRAVLEEIGSRIAAIPLDQLSEWVGNYLMNQLEKHNRVA